MNEVPPEVWITGHASSSASSLTASPVRDVCTPWPTSRIGFLAARDQLGRLGDLRCAGPVIDQAVRTRAAGDLRHFELFQNDVRRILDVGRAGRCRHRTAESPRERSRRSGRHIRSTRCTSPLASKSASWRTNWIRPRRTRRSVMRARWPPRKMTGEFSTLAHIIAPARLATPGPSVPMHSARLAGHPRDSLGHETGTLFVVRRDHRPAARFRLKEHVYEVRVGNTEQRIDALGLEQVENALVNGHTHGQISLISDRYVWAVDFGGPGERNGERFGAARLRET